MSNRGTSNAPAYPRLAHKFGGQFSVISFQPMSRSNLIGLLPSELEDLAVSPGASRYRGPQLATWIYRKGAADLDAMSDLPKDFRARLAESHEIAVPEIERATPSQDGSRKLVFRLADARRVSAVL